MNLVTWYLFQLLYQYFFLRNDNTSVIVSSLVSLTVLVDGMSTSLPVTFGLELVNIPFKLNGSCCLFKMVLNFTFVDFMNIKHGSRYLRVARGSG